MGWSEMEDRCKKHPKHRQSKGVCPSCLRERLSNLSASSSTNTSSSFSSPYHSYDSVSSSACSPDSSSFRDPKVKMSLLMKPSEPLTKSRSMAFVISNDQHKKKMVKKEKKEKSEEGGKEIKKKGGFWSKLGVGSKKRRKEVDVLMHSKTMKETTSSARWIFFP